MLCGLLGRKLGHSYSPQIHASLGDYIYRLFEQEPETLASFLRNENFTGLNVTIPYKKAAASLCDALSPVAERLGAVNTVVKDRNGKITGHNTDYFGFLSMVKKSGLNFNGKKVLVLGSGGASATVVAATEDLGGIPVVISRSGENNYENLHKHKDAAVLVNATPVGMYPNNGTSPVDLNVFPSLEGVLDLIYNPACTKLLLDAKDRNLITLNGLYMLVAQAKESAEWFTGNTINDGVIDDIYDDLRFNMENILLIGMPGSGKSTVGKQLSTQLDRPFFDADEETERLASKPIPEIFKEQGEAGFRKLESQALTDLCKKSGAIIATGGGCVTVPENIPILRQNSVVVWLKRDLEQLPTEGRPLSQTTDIQRMYEIRKPLYHNCADLQIVNDGTAEETAKQIIKALRERT